MIEPGIAVMPQSTHFNKRKTNSQKNVNKRMSELRKADHTVGVNCNIFSKYITVHPNRMVSLSEFSFLDKKFIEAMHEA